MTEEDRLRARYEEKASAGLVDVRFALRSPREATTETICGETNRLLDAFERGDARPARFR